MPRLFDYFGTREEMNILSKLSVVIRRRKCIILGLNQSQMVRPMRKSPGNMFGHGQSLASARNRATHVRPATCTVAIYSLRISPNIRFLTIWLPVSSGHPLLPTLKSITVTIASPITGVSIVCWAVCSGADQRTHESSASLVFVRGIYRWPVDSPHKGPVTRKMFAFDDVMHWCSDCLHYVEGVIRTFFLSKDLAHSARGLVVPKPSCFRIFVRSYH